MPPPPSLLRRLLHAPIIGPAVRAARGVFAAEPFDPRPQDQAPPTIPERSYATDQPVAPPADGTPFDPHYHGYTFVSAVPQPVTFGGITLEAGRNFLEQHDSGVSFYGSSVLSIAMTRFPEVYSALGVRCAPSISLPRQIEGGSRGLARIVREETEAAICPPMNRPSPYFPSVLWGAIEIDLAMMGFFVLQHVYGKPNARGIRKMWTRRWPTWAVYYDAPRKTYVALTTNGPVDILNDGKFTLGGKTDIPHLQGALRSLLLPVFDGVQVIQARAGWIDQFSSPKPTGTMPEGMGPRSPEGKAFYEAIRLLKMPGGYGVLPHGATLTWESLSAEASASFKEALDSDNSYVDKVLTGLDTNATGVYKPIAFWGILRSTVGDDLAATIRSVNIAIEHETRFNHGDDLAEKDYPALTIPLPDPEADARFDAAAKRQRNYSEQLEKDRAAGIVVDEDRNAELAAELGAKPGVLTKATAQRKPPLPLAPTDLAKVVTVDEARDRAADLPPIGDARGDLTISELDAQSKAGAMPGAPASQEQTPAAPREDEAPDEEKPTKEQEQPAS